MVCDGNCFSCAFSDCVCDDGLIDDFSIQFDMEVLQSRCARPKPLMGCLNLYYLEHRQERIDYQKARYRKNRGKLLEYQKKRYRENREKLLAYQKLYYARKRLQTKES